MGTGGNAGPVREQGVRVMAYDFQVAVDAAQPHVLADWWAQTLGWEVEPTDAAFIQRMVAEGYASDDDTMTHNGSLVWKAGAAIGHPGGRDSGRSRVLFQLVPESKTVKNRVHLDLRVGPDDVEPVVRRLTGRGATFLHRGQQGPHGWVTMADPEGNEFCVS
jgi:Glyoxalase-like domain